MSKKEPKTKVGLFVLALFAISAVVTTAMYLASTSAIPQSRTLTPNTDPQVTQQQEEAILQFVSSTEYIPGQTGQVIVEARYRNGSSALISEGETLLIDSTQQYTYDNVSQDNTGSIQQVDTYTANFQADEDPNTTANVSASMITLPFGFYHWNQQLKNYWDMDTNTDAITGQAFSLTQQAAIVSAEGIDGQSAVRLDGDGDSIDTNVQVPDGDFTIVTLLYSDSGMPENQGVLSTWNQQDANSDGFVIRCSEVSQYINGSRFDISTSGVCLDQGWTTLILTHDNSTGTMEIYYNDTFQQSFSTAGDLTNSYDLNIGRQAVFNVYNGLTEFDGTVDYSSIFTKVLNGSEIQDVSNQIYREYFLENDTYESVAIALSQDVEIIDFDVTATGNYSVQFTCNADDPSPDWTGYGDGNDVSCVTNGDSLKYRVQLDGNATDATEITEIQAQAFITTDDLWESKTMYMDGRTQNVCQYKGGQYFGARTCPWTYNSGDSYYKCGQSRSSMQAKINESDGNVTTGVKATLAIEPVNDPASYAAIYLTDNNASEWRMIQGGEINCNSPPTFEETYYGPVGADGLVLDTTDFTLYQVIGGQFSQLAHSNTYENVFCTPSGSYGACDGSGKQNFEFRAENGRAIVRYNGNLVFNVSTEYYPNEKTTYGFLGNDYFRDTILRVYDVQNVYATQQQYSLENVTNCVADIQYPDKTYLFESKSMILNQNGNAYTEFTVPDTEGVYEYQTRCSILSNTQTASKSFHVTDPGIGAMVVK